MNSAVDEKILKSFRKTNIPLKKKGKDLSSKLDEQ